MLEQIKELLIRGIDAEKLIQELSLHFTESLEDELKNDPELQKYLESSATLKEFFQNTDPSLSETALDLIDDLYADLDYGMMYQFDLVEDSVKEELLHGRLASSVVKDMRRGGITFGEFGDRARRLGSFLAQKPLKGKAVAVFMDKSTDMIAGFMGAVYAGCFYCPVDITMPEERIRTIFSGLRPAAVLVREADRERAESLVAGASYETWTVIYEEAVQFPVNESALRSIRQRSTDYDPLYVLFTSGSTGVPKGVLVPHRVILNNMEWLEREYHFTSDEVLANQVPFYFDVSDHDIYCVLKFGCSMVIVPPEDFAFPVKLVKLLNEYKVTAIFWVPFALCMAANLNAFQAEKPEYLRYIFVAGEVMPVKQLNYVRADGDLCLHLLQSGPGVCR